MLNYNLDSMLKLDKFLIHGLRLKQLEKDIFGSIMKGTKKGPILLPNLFHPQNKGLFQKRKIVLYESLICRKVLNIIIIIQKLL